MRLLLDESVPAGLRDQFPTHQVATVGESGWAGCTNGRLLALAAKRFDVLITVDKNLQHQQNLQSLPLAVVVLSANKNTLQALVPLAAKVEQVLASLTPGSLVVVT